MSYEGVVFGLLPPEEQEKLQKAEKVQVYYDKGWCDDDTKNRYSTIAYRIAPPALPRLTLEWIEGHGGWPPMTKIAVVNDDGYAHFGSDYDAQPVSGGGWGGIGQIWTMIPGKFDATDWRNSLIMRPDPKKRLRPWRLGDKIPAPLMVREKDWPKHTWDYASVLDGGVQVGAFSYMFKELLAEWEQHDGSPCGVEEEAT